MPEFTDAWTIVRMRTIVLSASKILTGISYPIHCRQALPGLRGRVSCVDSIERDRLLKPRLFRKSLAKTAAHSDCPISEAAYNEDRTGERSVGTDRWWVESGACLALRDEIMASERDKCADSSHDDTSTCRLAALRKRSQVDFEIDFFERILSRDPNYVEVLVNLGDLFARKGCHRRALQVDTRLSQLRPRDPTVFYNLACSHAVLSHMTEALAALEQAADLGYSDLEHLLSDPDLASVRCHVGFRRILAKLEAACSATRLV